MLLLAHGIGIANHWCRWLYQRIRLNLILRTHHKRIIKVFRTLPPTFDFWIRSSSASEIRAGRVTNLFYTYSDSSRVIRCNMWVLVLIRFKHSCQSGGTIVKSVPGCCNDAWCQSHEIYMNQTNIVNVHTQCRLNLTESISLSRLVTLAICNRH